MSAYDSILSVLKLANLIFSVYYSIYINKDAANVQSASSYKMVIVGSLMRFNLCEEELQKQFVIAR